MKAVEQQQPNSMESNNSTNGSTDYAYRPLTTKHRRAGSTGTTGEEDYTTDEDELYGDETDCSGPSLHPSHLILKSDLARATTELFGYGSKYEDRDDEPTSLFDEDDNKFQTNNSSKAISLFTYNESMVPSRGVLTRHRKLSTASDNAIAAKNSDVHSFSDQPTEQMTKLNDNRITSIDIATNEISNDSNSDSLIKDEASETRDRWFHTNKEEPKEGTNEMEKDDESSCAAMSLEWNRVAAEVKEHAVTKLQEELKKAHEELKLKDEEVSRLSRIRSDVEAELQELTASLFQEANKMVQEANIRKANAERLLEESRMKNEVLAAEVAALKTLVLTSTPARPNPHLHPQIDTRCRNGNGNGDDGQPGLFAKKHRRSPSHFNLKYGRENSPPESPQKEQRISLPSDKATDTYDKDWEKDKCKEKEREKELEREKERERENQNRESGPEVDPRVYSEFLAWKENPSLDKSEPFIGRVFREDIDLCLDFPNEQLGSKVRQAVLDGNIFIEAVSDKTKPAFPKRCALLEASRHCHYRMRLGDQENQWHFISQICRNRIIAVIEFLNYLRYIERGLVKSSVHDIYWEITRLRKEMVNARLGLMLSS